MLEVDYNPPKALQRRHLLLMSLSLAVAACGVWYLVGARILTVGLLLLSGAAFSGFAAFNAIGRDVFLVLTVAFSVLGRIISWLALSLTFVLAVTIPGLTLRLFGMDQLQRDFEACRGKQSMFRDPPVSDSESFRRQS